MSCCLAVIAAIVALCVMALEVIAGLIILDIVFLCLYLGSKGQSENAKKMKPSKMICPNCNSSIVKIKTMKAGKSTSSTFYSRSAQHNTTIHYKRMAECKSCGFGWDYITQEDIENECKRLDNLTRGYGVIFVILLIITIWIFI